MDKPDGQLSDDQRQQREKADQSLKDGAESGVYLPPEAETPQSLKSQPPDDDDQQPETLGQRIFAIVFLTVFLAILGGVVCAWLGQVGMAKQYIRYRHLETDPGVFRLLEDWRVQFAIGAVIGAVCGIVFCFRFWTGRVEEFDPEKNDEV